MCGGFLEVNSDNSDFQKPVLSKDIVKRKGSVHMIYLNKVSCLTITRMYLLFLYLLLPMNILLHSFSVTASAGYKKSIIKQKSGLSD